MRNKKALKHSGWVVPRSTLNIDKDTIISECFDPEPYWDDWVDHRDGFRDWFSDRTKLKNIQIIYGKITYDKEQGTIMLKNRYKLKRLLKRRKAMKNGNTVRFT